MERLNLDQCGAIAFCDLMARVTRLGIDQAYTAANPTGKALCRRYCTVWRIGHERALRYAYRAGRFHAEDAARPE